MFLAMTLQGGLCFAFPDVCKTPPYATPIPYPNSALGQEGNAATLAQKVYICNQQAYILKSKIPMSHGDEPGVMGGVVSGVNMNQCGFVRGSAAVIIEGSPGIMLFCPTKQNGSNPNCYGTHVSPSQFKVFYLR
jgi:hypothetical protein